MFQLREAPGGGQTASAPGQHHTHGLAVRIRSFVRGNEALLLPMALAIGCAAGVAVAAMSWAAQLSHVVIFGIPIDTMLSANASVSPVAALAAPLAGGLLLGLMEWFRRRWKLSQAVDPIEANALRGGTLSLRDSVVVSGQTLISNGCGASVGLEAGYTQIGAGTASWIGQRFKLRRNDLRMMVGCGAAGAISAAFNAPLTGVFYACELIVGLYSVLSAGPLLVSALAAAFVAGQLGQHPYAIELVAPVSGGFSQSAALVCLSIVSGSIGIAVMYAAAAAERGFNRLPMPFWIKPGLGGACVGVLAMYTPQVLAAGHGAMSLDLNLRMAAGTIAVIACLKILACIVSLASGFRGGLFFASLFVGCLVGKFFEASLSWAGYADRIGLDATTSALTGMATLGVAIVGGPLTMTFLVLEMTRNFELAATVLLSCIVASVFVRAVFGYSFSTWRLHLRGESIRSADDVGWFRGLTVRSMMRTDVATVRSDATIAASRRHFHLGSCEALFVLDPAGKYVGAVKLSDIFVGNLDAVADDTMIGDLAENRDIVLLPWMNVRDALRSFERAEADVLPVVNSAADSAVIGFLSETYARRRYIQEFELASSASQ